LACQEVCAYRTSLPATASAKRRDGNGPRASAPDDILFRFGIATDRVPYYFGQEIQDYLETIRIHMIDLELSNSMLKNPTVPDRATWAERRKNHFLGVTDLYKESPAIFKPYIQAHQKIEDVRRPLPAV
jgi:hypothetical protein